MKTIFFLAVVTLTLTCYGQDKYNYINFNKMKEVKGTEYVIASIENKGKMYKTKSRYLLFINTKNGKTNQVDFPSGTWIENIEQIKIDSLGINLILVAARTIDINNKNGIDFDDPIQIMVFSTDGIEKKQLTDNNYFVRNWTINELTGTIIVTGYYDSNNNNEYDKTDENKILIYDLKTLKEISRI